MPDAERRLEDHDSHPGAVCPIMPALLIPLPIPGKRRKGPVRGGVIDPSGGQDVRRLRGNRRIKGLMNNPVEHILNISGREIRKIGLNFPVKTVSLLFQDGIVPRAPDGINGNLLHIDMTGRVSAEAAVHNIHDKHIRILDELLRSGVVNKVVIGKIRNFYCREELQRLEGLIHEVTIGIDNQQGNLFCRRHARHQPHENHEARGGSENFQKMFHGLEAIPFRSALNAILSAPGS